MLAGSMYVMGDKTKGEKSFEYKPSPISGTKIQQKKSAVVLAEMESIVKTAKENGTYLKAPNGKATKLNPDQWAEVRTNNFKNWFGDWENDSVNASKVVDGNGEPMVVYHNSPSKDVDEFKGTVTYFTDNKKYAGSVKGAASPNQYEAYLNIRKPYEAPSPLADVPKEVHDTDQYTNPRFIKSGNGKYDSVIGKDAGQTDGITYAVFSPNQIKSATDNAGEFSKDSNKIQQKKGAVELPDTTIKQMTEDDKGNYLFYHYSPNSIKVTYLRSQLSLLPSNYLTG